MVTTRSMEKKSVPDQESGGHLAKVTSVSADNRHVEFNRQTDEMAIKEEHADEADGKPSDTDCLAVLRKGILAMLKTIDTELDLDPDPFSQVFDGPNHTKLPAPQLLRLQARLLQKARDLGYGDTLASLSPAASPDRIEFSGAALVSIVERGLEGSGPGTGIFDPLFQRLVEAAEESDDLTHFLNTLNQEGDWVTHDRGVPSGWDGRSPRGQAMLLVKLGILVKTPSRIYQSYLLEATVTNQFYPPCQHAATCEVKLLLEEDQRKMGQGSSEHYTVLLCALEGLTTSIHTLLATS